MFIVEVKPPILHMQVWSRVLGSTAVEKRGLKYFFESRGSYTKSDTLPQVMSLESALGGAEHNKFDNEVWS